MCHGVRAIADIGLNISSKKKHQFLISKNLNLKYLHLWRVTTVIKIALTGENFRIYFKSTKNMCSCMAYVWETAHLTCTACTLRPCYLCKIWNFHCPQHPKSIWESLVFLLKVMTLNFWIFVFIPSAEYLHMHTCIHSSHHARDRTCFWTNVSFFSSVFHM